MADLILYTNPMSRGRVARWMLEEIGVPYRTEFLDYGSTEPGGMKAADYLAINPMGKVPAIVHTTDKGDQVVTQGGMLAKVVKVKETDEVDVEIATGVVVRVVRSTIVQVLNKTDPVK